LGLAADERTIILLDAGHGPDGPGSGKVYVYDAEALRLRGTILLPSGNGGQPRNATAVAMGTDPGMAFVTTGTARVGPTFPPDPAALIQLDINAMITTRVIPLNDWGVGRPFVF
jgi:hypothetical protein